MSKLGEMALPTGIVTGAGWIPGSVLVIVTCGPSGGCGRDSVTVPVATVPPVMELGTFRACSEGRVPVPFSVTVGTFETTTGCPLTLCVISIVMVADCDPSVVGWKLTTTVTFRENPTPTTLLAILKSPAGVRVSLVIVSVSFADMAVRLIL